MGAGNKKEMTVRELEKIVKTGDIVVSRNRFRIFDPLSYLSLLIRMFAKTYYNHAAIVVFNWDKPFTNEAIGRGVITHRFGTRIIGRDIMVLRSKKFINRERIARRANSITGLTPYDFIGLVYQAMYLTTGKWLGKKGSSAGERMYCFEYVSWVYKKLFPSWYKVTPSEVINSDKFKVVLQCKVEA